MRLKLFGAGLILLASLGIIFFIYVDFMVLFW